MAQLTSTAPSQLAGLLSTRGRDLPKPRVGDPRQAADIISFVFGYPDRETLPAASIAEATKRAMDKDGDWALQYGKDTGTPALPMDIRYIHGDLYNFGYQVEAGPDTTIELALYGSELRHSMDNYKLRQPPASAADWRRNTAKSDNLGFRLEGTLRDDGGMWTLGTDGFDSTHDSDIDNPNNAMFFVRNFNSAEREVLGAFVERQQSLGANWTAEFGARYNRVDMDAGKVDGILVSGDNGREDYNEPAQMKEDLVALGVPADYITADYAGFRTLDSIYRAEEVFGLHAYTVVSQPFHLERALYLAGQRGQDVIGYAAYGPAGYWGRRVRAREVLARALAVLDVEVLGREPRFLGEPVTVTRRAPGSS